MSIDTLADTTKTILVARRRIGVRRNTMEFFSCMEVPVAIARFGEIEVRKSELIR
jgi:hypothetical protein